MNIFASIYLDEDVSNLVARLLRSRGIDVTTVQEQQMLGRSDPEQIAHATSLKRFILTHNRVDYEEIHLQCLSNNMTHFGIIVIPQKNSHDIVARTMVLLDTLTADELENQLIYI